jgi:hypothetical protein
VVTIYPLYQAPLWAVKAIEGRKVPLLTIVTDLVAVHRVWFSRAADLCLMLMEAARDTAPHYGLSQGRVEVVGIPVDPEIAPEERDRCAIRADLGWLQDLATLMTEKAQNAQRLGRPRAAYDIANECGWRWNTDWSWSSIRVSRSAHACASALWSCWLALTFRGRTRGDRGFAPIVAET